MPRTSCWVIVDPPCGKSAAPSQLVVTAAPHEPSRQHADPDLAEHARHAEVVDPVVGEEALVLGGQDRVTDDRWNVLVPRDLAVLSSQLDERPAAGVVDVADRWELKTREGPQVGQVVAIEVDVMELGDRQQRGEHGRGGNDAPTGEKEDDAPGPARSA